MLNNRNPDGVTSLESDRSSIMKQMAYFLLIIPIYLILSPSVFGPITSTVAVGGDQHALINPIMHYIHEFDKYNDPLTRIADHYICQIHGYNA